MKKYTVKVTKKDGMKSIYYVLALSAGGAENAILKDVYNAMFSFADEGWPETVNWPDLCSRQVKNVFIANGIEKEMTS